MTRTFEDKPATRAGGIPLLIGLMGPGNGGKTFSALRLADGIQRVRGGETFLIDTENKRSLSYSDRFRFRHVPFVPPFDPASYVLAARHCVDRGATVVIIDSMSDEHEGDGGLLDQHDAEIARGAKDPSAWIAPKKARRKMCSALSALDCALIFCFRAEEKNFFAKGKQPQSQGYVPITGGPLIHAMTACALLMPLSSGVPTWQSSEPGERRMIKLPWQFEKFLGEPRQLDEGIGEAMARWAAADSGHAHAELAAAIAEASTQAQLDALVPRLRAAKTEQLVTPSEHESLRDAFGDQKRRMKDASAEPSAPQSAPEPDDRDPDDPENY